jgi:zinc transporter ZupT
MAAGSCRPLDLDKDSVMTIMVSFSAIVVLALVHLFAGKLRWLEGVPRSRSLSIASGVSVAYVFVHLLPELSEGQEVLSERAGAVLATLDHHIYLLALTGLAAFYGLERLASRSRRAVRLETGEDRTTEGVFWLHITSFSVYNGLIGYLLLDRKSTTVEEVRGLIFFAIAMALHFVITDYGLREHHKDAYARVGRWVLAAAVVLGWVIGLVFEVSEAALFVLLALLAGGVILNVLKEELPEERESRFWAFGLGAAAYAALLLAF